MNKVTVNASRKYEVLIGAGLLGNIGNKLSNLITGMKVMLVSDDSVYALYGDKVENALTESGYSVSQFIIPHGEQSKNLSNYSLLVEKMFEAKLTRNDVVIALGGGVVGDLAGFAAATYQRGTGFVVVPTSLLAAVDSSVGGKTAVDLEHGKNQVGAFYQPMLVLCDTDTLKTLPYEEYINGCAEVIKYSMITDEGLFDLIDNTPIKDNYEKIITKCVSIKRDFVEEDEFDLGKRMMLNFGHTFGHAIEACSHYTIPHGKAVAIGMASITKAAVVHGYCLDETQEKLTGLIEKYDLPTELTFKAQELLDAALSDKKNGHGLMRIIVPKSIGKCTIKEIYKDDCIDWLVHGGAR